MPLYVKHLNGDTTFLLTFAPSIAPAHAKARFPGSFTVLVDPWLVGPSSVWTPRFQISHHTKQSPFTSLTQVPRPDLIIISQDKPDHCHKETLCSLPSNSRVTILAVPAAANRIKSWKHFECATILSIQPYNANKLETLYRIPLEPYTASCNPGEVTIAYMPEKRDMTGLHTAFGITYRAPGTTYFNRHGDFVRLPITPPASPPKTPTSQIRPPTSGSRPGISPDRVSARADSMMDGQEASLRKDDKPISVIYTPHGISESALADYAYNHLVSVGALPVTALFHAINEEQNPWFMGGRVVAGLPSAIEIIKRVGARYWFSAHDEEKDNRGWATALIKSKHYSINEAQEVLDNALGAEGFGHASGFRQSKIMDLDVGEEVKV